jgi:purine nucleosidase
MMPLDSTQIALPPVLQRRILQQPDPLSQALSELVREANRKVILYDPLTVAFADDPQICPTKPMHIEVDGEGYTRPSPGKPNAGVCLQSYQNEFLKIFAQRLSKN